MIVVPFDHTIDEGAYLRSVAKRHPAPSKRPLATEVSLAQVVATLVFSLALCVAGVICMAWFLDATELTLQSLSPRDFAAIARGAN